MNQRPSAILLDFDGTMVDSKDFNEAIEKVRMASFSSRPKLESLLSQNQHLVKPSSSIKSLLTYLDQQKIPYCICSNNREETIRYLCDSFDWNIPHILTPKGNIKPKPLPDIYMAGLEKLGVDPAQRRHTFAIEDSLTGLRAAKTAGIGSIYVGKKRNPAVLKSCGARYALPSIDHLLSALKDPKNTKLL